MPVILSKDVKHKKETEESQRLGLRVRMSRLTVGLDS